MSNPYKKYRFGQHVVARDSRRELYVPFLVVMYTEDGIVNCRDINDTLLTFKVGELKLKRRGWLAKAMLQRADHRE